MTSCVDKAVGSAVSRVLLPIAAVAVMAGLFVRFWSLGSAPLAVDEYYFGMSILNVLERGLPEFACGGYYTRGVIIQYLSVPLLQAGLSLEYAVRFWPAVASCFAILGVWRIGRSVCGIPMAALATALMSLSLWEIEFARFGRMYAPFQAVFVWYIYFQVRHLVHADEFAKWWALLLSAVSIFVYAGASFLLILNFLPLVWRQRRWNGLHTALSGVLLVGGVQYYSTDFRYSGIPADALLPANVNSVGGTALPIEIPVIPEVWLPMMLFGVATSALVFWWFRRSLALAHPAILYWLFAALSLGFGLFAFAAGLTVAGLLLGIPTARPLWDNFNTKSVTFLLLLMAAWAAVIAGSHISADLTVGDTIRNTIKYLFDYPDVYYRVVREWFITIPATTVALAVLVVPVFLKEIRRSLGAPGADPSGVRYLLGALIVLSMLAAIFQQPYMVTRYTYFLYPVILLLAAAGILLMASTFRSARLQVALPVTVLIALPLLTEDYSLAHAARINQPEYRYRTIYSPRLSAHYYARWDFRAPAQYINENLRPLDRVLVFDEPLTQYLDRTDAIYIRSGTEIHQLVWACEGMRHLWSNTPLLDTEGEVAHFIAEAPGRVWLITRTEAVGWMEPLERELIERYALEPRFRSVDGHLAAYVIDESG